MGSLKEQVGTSSGPFFEDVTPALIQNFGQAVGAKLYQVDGKLVATPTFMTRFRKGEFELFQKLGIELSKVLHAEQEYQYSGMILEGDRIQFDTVLTQAFEKQGSTTKMQFVMFETNVQALRQGQSFSVGKAKTTIVVRDNGS